MLLKELFISAFWVQNVGQSWVKIDKECCFKTNRLTTNSVFPKEKFLTAIVS